MFKHARHSKHSDGQRASLYPLALFNLGKCRFSKCIARQKTPALFNLGKCRFYAPRDDSDFLPSCLFSVVFPFCRSTLLLSSCTRDRLPVVNVCFLSFCCLPSFSRRRARLAIHYRIQAHDVTTPYTSPMSSLHLI